jgi:hypothetical protein
MDKEQARFILRSFRPDGADSSDPGFAEALALAVQDRELGEWLAAQRAFDADFARVLGTAPIPEMLREDILGCLAAGRGGFPQAEDAQDAVCISAIASIRPPAGLRGEILTAMERGRMEAQAGAFPPRSLWRRLALPLTAAAGVTLAFLLNHRNSHAPAPAASAKIPVEVVQAGFIHTFQSPLFSLDETHQDPDAIMNHLESRELPCPCCLPPGLNGVKSIGCRELVIDGKRGSLVCFEEGENGIVHLVIFRREDVDGELPDRGRPLLSQHGHWSTARWEDGRHVYILVGTSDMRKLASLF